MKVAGTLDEQVERHGILGEDSKDESLARQGLSIGEVMMVWSLGKTKDSLFSKGITA